MAETSENLSTNELYKKLAEYLDSKFYNQKKEIEKLLKTVENKQKELKQRIIELERRARKNNIVIFGLKTKKEDDLLIVVIEKLNSLLSTDINPTQINDIYKIGKNDTIILEFISNLYKKEVLKKTRRLKGTGIFISHDLCKEDQKDNKILYNNLKAAKSKNFRAYIKGNKLYVNNEPYTVQQLENISTPPGDSDILIEASSVPTTPPTIIREPDNVFLDDITSINRSQSQGQSYISQQKCSSVSETLLSPKIKLPISTSTSKIKTLHRSNSQLEDEVRRLRSKRK